MPPDQDTAVTVPAPLGRVLAGLTYSLPISGVIRTGSVVVRSGRRLPHRDDEFRVTRMHQAGDDRAWVAHPVDQALRASAPGSGDQPGTSNPEGDGAEAKLRRIPVRLEFDDPDLILQEQYAAFFPNGRPRCVGNGRTARRVDGSRGTVSDEACSGPDRCPVAEEFRCGSFARLTVCIDVPGYEADRFVLRSGSINAVTGLRAFLVSHKALLGGLAGLQVWLDLDPKSSAQSMHTTFWFPSMRLRTTTLREAATALKAAQEADAAAGVNRRAFEATLHALLGNGLLAEGRDDFEQFEELILGRDPAVRSEVDESMRAPEGTQDGPLGALVARLARPDTAPSGASSAPVSAGSGSTGAGGLATLDAQ